MKTAYVLLLLALCACQDDTRPATPAGPDASAPDGSFDAHRQVDLLSEPDVQANLDAESPPAPEPAFVQLNLDPRQATFSRDEHPTATALVFDRFGDTLNDVALVWSVVPPGAGEIDAQGRVTFLAEGAGAVRACATPDLCGRATFFVDDEGATLVLTAPLPGAILSGQPSIEVRGQTSSGAAVFVNDVAVPVAADGSFVTAVPAVFGLNRLVTLADDGVRRPTAIDVREVLYAPRLLPVTPEGVDLGPALILRIAQRLLDADAVPPEPNADGRVLCTDVASVIELLLSRSEPMRLLGDPHVATGPPVDLTLTDVEIGTPEVELRFTDEGLEAFVRFGDLALTTSGEMRLEGETFSLDGVVTLGATGYVSIAIEAGPDGTPGIRLLGADVAVESLSANLVDSTAQAVFDTVGSILRGVIEGVGRDLVVELLHERLPGFVELGLGDTLGPLRDVPLDVEGQDSRPPIHLRLGFTVAGPATTADAALTLSLAGEVKQPSPPLSLHETPGVAVEDDDTGPSFPPDAAATIAVRMSTLNAILHEVWRQGALTFDLTPSLPESLRGFVSGARLDARLPPLVVGSPAGSQHLFEVQLGEVDLFADVPGRAMPDHFVVSARSGASLSIVDGRVRFELVEPPDLRVVLRETSGDSAILPPDALAELIAILVWPQAREALGDALDLSLGEISLGLDALQGLAPGVSSLRVLPTFPVPPRLRGGWLVLTAAVQAELE